MKLPPAWREFIASLCSHRVRFLVVGAHALAANGRPRATQDIDIFVEPTPKNAARLGAALVAFGFVELGKQTREFSRPDRMATLGRPPLRIDVMTSISGVSFARAYRGRLVVELDGRKVGFLGRAELLINKAASARPKDLLDIALLEEVTPSAAASRPPKRSRARK